MIDKNGERYNDRCDKVGNEIFKQTSLDDRIPEFLIDKTYYLNSE